MLSSHPAVRGFPETFYFLHSRPAPRNHWSRHYHTWRQAQFALADAKSRLGLPGRLSLFERLASPAQLDRRFLALLDQQTFSEGKSMWSEKTPGHINCIERISRLDPAARFIHVLRDGRDVVASLEDVRRQRESAGMSGGAWSLSESIYQWNHCLAVSLGYSAAHNHFLAGYQSLVDSPGQVLSGICKFLGLPWDNAMLDYQRQSTEVLGRDVGNSWRRDVLSPLRDTHLVKYQNMFGTEEQAQIEGQLSCGGRLCSSVIN